MITVYVQVFKDESKEWRCLPLTQQNWTQFKTHFFEACQDWKVESRHNTEKKHTNNEIVDGMENYSRRTVEALQTMAHSTNSINEEQVQHMENITV